MAADPALMVRVVQIRFHWTERVEGIASVDFHPTLPKFLTSGGDGSVKVWSWSPEDADANMRNPSDELSTVFTFLSVLTSDDHPTPNVARWSPHGNLILASYVSGEVIIWKPADHTPGYFDKADERSLNKEHWAVHKTLKLPADATDACFTACGKYVISACVTGSLFVHSTETGLVMQQLTASDGAHEVSCQSVAADPLGRFVASGGADGYVKFYQLQPRKHGVELRMQHGISKYENKIMFKKETSAMRRSAWSPDGAVYAAPCGWMATEEDQFRDCVFLFARNNLSRHFAYLTTQGKKVVSGVKFAPFVLEPSSSSSSGENGDAEALTTREACASWGPPQYRYVLAIWTRMTVSIYTSGCSVQVCKLCDLHYDVINDVAFTMDARFLAVCSNDGFVTLARFRDPLGRLARYDVGNHPLSRALAIVRPPLVQSCLEVETNITKPSTAPQAGSASNVNVVRVVSKKKPKPTTTTTAAAPAGSTAAASASPSTAEANDDSVKRPRPDGAEDIEQPARPQPAPPPPPVVEVTAEELGALMDD